MIDSLLIVGLGSIGQRHLRLAREMFPGARIAAVRQLRARTPDVTGPVQEFATVEDALSMHPAAAVVATPATMHAAAASLLVDAGVHVLVEKPLAASSAGIEALVARARERGVVFVTGYNLRFLPSLRRFRDLVTEGRVGRVHSVRAEVGQWLPAWRPGADYRAGVSAQAALGGGVLLELSHELDYLRWIFGEVAWVSAILLRQSELEIDVEDTAHLVLGFEGGPVAPVVASLSMDFTRHDATRTCTAIGERGSLRWNGISDTIEVLDRGRADWQALAQGHRDTDESYRAQLVHFGECIAGARPVAATAEDGLAVVRITEAARQSSASGGIVRLGRREPGRAIEGAA